MGLVQQSTEGSHWPHIAVGDSSGRRNNHPNLGHNSRSGASRCSWICSPLGRGCLRGGRRLRLGWWAERLGGGRMMLMEEGRRKRLMQRGPEYPQARRVPRFVPGRSEGTIARMFTVSEDMLALPTTIQASDSNWRLCSYLGGLKSHRS